MQQRPDKTLMANQKPAFGHLTNEKRRNSHFCICFQGPVRVAAGREQQIPKSIPRPSGKSKERLEM